MPLGDAGVEARESLRSLLADVERASPSTGSGAGGKSDGEKQAEGVRLLASVLLLAQLAAPATMEGVATDLAIALRKALRASGVGVAAPEGAESDGEEDGEDGEPHYMDVLVVSMSPRFLPPC